MTDSTGRDRLRRLGGGVRIADICAADGLTREAFDAWWAAACDARLPHLGGHVGLPVHAQVEILRDARGVPHVFAASDHDLFVAYGFVMGQDRLFQMDLRRRRGAGRLAEVLGPGQLEADVLARTMEQPRLAAAELARLPGETRALFEAFAAGVNAAADEARARGALPIEYDLLEFEPEPWTALDSVLSAVAWRWQLTGRPWVISVPELAKRTLGGGPLYDAVIRWWADADEEPIVPPGESTAVDAGLIPIASVAVPRSAGAGGTADPSRLARPVSFVDPELGLDGIGGLRGGFGFDSEASRAFGDPRVQPMGGSNNWVVSGTRSRSGKPLLASDPHMPYEAASSFYEIHLSGGSFECAGAGFVGYPGLTFGRNRHLAWGITNNICSQRDLYIERDPAAVVAEREEVIHVRGAEPVRLAVAFTERGPIVDRLLPTAARPDGPVSMRWVGQLACDWASAQLRLDRAESVDAALIAVQGWLSPTFSLVVADDHDEHGHIAFTNTGSYPVRGRPERGYRDAAEPADAWQGLVPPQGMPQTRDPSDGWIGSANNRPIADAGHPYPLHGTWDEGLRHRRIDQLVHQLTPHDRTTFGRMQADNRSGRADAWCSAVLAALDGQLDGIDEAALEILRSWTGDANLDAAGATIWEVFWARWTQAVSAARFPAGSSDFLATWMHGVAGRMVTADTIGWFPSDEARRATLLGAWREAIAELRTALGDAPAEWRWGEIHRRGLRHPLSAVGDLGALLDQPAPPADGDTAVLNNVGHGGGRIPPASPDYRRNWEGTGGAGYRLVVDLGDPAGSAWTATLEGQSANAGSPNRSDQIDDFLAARYHEIPLDWARATAAAVHRITAEPRGRHD